MKKPEFKAQYINVIDEINLTDTQSIRVGIVDTDTTQPDSTLVVGVQKFWKKEVSEDWRAGKGFYLNVEVAERISEDILEAVKELSATSHK